MKGFLIVITFMLLSCSINAVASNNQDCYANFTKTGSFFGGTQFKTHITKHGISKSQAVARVAKLLTMDGMNVTRIDKELGIVTATQTVSYGSGKVAPLNVAIDGTSTKLNIDMTYSMSGGVSASANTGRDYFCKISNAISRE